MTDRFAPKLTIHLNRYQVDNLRWLIHLAGYGSERVEPFDIANSGDWLGELWLKLKDIAPDLENDSPNVKPGEAERMVKRWVVDQCD